MRNFRCRNPKPGRTVAEYARAFGVEVTPFRPDVLGLPARWVERIARTQCPACGMLLVAAQPDDLPPMLRDHLDSGWCWR